jgi:hypothetical protein
MWRTALRCRRGAEAIAELQPAAAEAAVETSSIPSDPSQPMPPLPPELEMQIQQGMYDAATVKVRRSVCISLHSPFFRPSTGERFLQLAPLLLPRAQAMAAAYEAGRAAGLRESEAASDCTITTRSRLTAGSPRLAVLAIPTSAHETPTYPLSPGHVRLRDTARDGSTGLGAGLAGLCLEPFAKTLVSEMVTTDVTATIATTATSAAATTAHDSQLAASASVEPVAPRSEDNDNDDDETAVTRVPPPHAESAAGDGGGVGNSSLLPDAATAQWVHSVPEDAEHPPTPSTVRSTQVHTATTAAVVAPLSQRSISEFQELQERLAKLAVATQAAAEQAMAERATAEAEAMAAAAAALKERTAAAAAAEEAARAVKALVAEEAEVVVGLRLAVAAATTAAAEEEEAVTVTLQAAGEGEGVSTAPLQSSRRSGATTARSAILGGVGALGGALRNVVTHTAGAVGGVVGGAVGGAVGAMGALTARGGRRAEVRSPFSLTPPDGQMAASTGSCVIIPWNLSPWTSLV